MAGGIRPVVEGMLVQEGESAGRRVVAFGGSVGSVASAQLGKTLSWRSAVGGEEEEVTPIFLA